MNPKKGEGLQSPELRPTIAPEVNSGVETNFETPAAAPETRPAKQAAPPVIVADDGQAPAIPQASVSLPQDEDDHQSASQPYKDEDRIEKRWVDSAKQIVAQTKDDPFKQKNEMSKVKAQYIKYRFNKVLKAD